jgi:ribosomal protein L11 methylase PrmA
VVGLGFAEASIATLTTAFAIAINESTDPPAVLKDSPWMVTGILVEDEEQICLSIRRKNLNINSVTSKNNWLLIKSSIT